MLIKGDKATAVDEVVVFLADGDTAFKLASAFLIVVRVKLVSMELAFRRLLAANLTFVPSFIVATFTDMVPSGLPHNDPRWEAVQWLRHVGHSN